MALLDEVVEDDDDSFLAAGFDSDGASDLAAGASDDVVVDRLSLR